MNTGAFSLVETARRVIAFQADGSVTTDEELANALLRSFSESGPSLIEAVID